MASEQSMRVEFEPQQLELATRKLSPEKLKHSLAVAELAARQGPEFATVGLLHDMLEDSDVTLDELRAVDVSDVELRAIQLLTRNKERAYEEYIAGIVACENRLAISVKLCDLFDHLHPANNAGLTDEKEERYFFALHWLVQTLRRVNAQKR